MALPPEPVGIQYIKISRIDGNGVDNTTALETLSTIVLPSGSLNREYTVLNVTETPHFYLYLVRAPNSEDTMAEDRSTLDYSFSGSYTGFQNSFRGFVPVTSSVDSLGFFLPEGNTNSLGSFGNPDFFISSYRLLTLPNKPLGVRVSSSFQFAITDGRSTTTSVTASVRILSSPIIAGGNTGIVPQSPTILASSVITQSAQNLDDSDLFFTGSYELFANIPINSFRPGDCIYFDIDVVADNNGTSVVADFNNARFTNGIFEISSSNATGVSKNLIIEPYFTSKFYGTDCDVTYGDISQGIPNPYLQNIEYNSGIIPTNFPALVNNTAIKSDIPQSNYTQLSSINIKYRGSKIQSQDVNIFDPRRATTDFGNDVNIGNYGQTPSINSFDTTIYEYEWGGGTTPEIMGGGSVKIGKVLQVNTKDSVKPINPGRGFNTIGIPVTLPSDSGHTIDPTWLTKWNRNTIVSQSVSDLYYTLNGNNPPGSEIQFNPYPNQQPGTQPTIPNISKIITTEYGVPSRSTFMVTSSANYNNSANGAGKLVNYSDYSEVRFFSNREISVVKSDYSPGTTISSTLFISGSFLGGDIFGRTFADATSSMMPIQDQLNIGERWFFTWFTNLETEGGFDSSNLNPKVLGNSPLLSKGVTEIGGISQSIHTSGYPLIHMILKDKIDESVISVGTSINIGNNGSTNNPPTGEPLGFLMWKARSPQRNEFVIVEDEITGGVGPGAFTDRYTTKEIVDNFEEITRNYGNNTSG